MELIKNLFKEIKVVFLEWKLILLLYATLFIWIAVNKLNQHRWIVISSLFTFIIAQYNYTRSKKDSFSRLLLISTTLIFTTLIIVLVSIELEFYTFGVISFISIILAIYITLIVWYWIKLYQVESRFWAIPIYICLAALLVIFFASIYASSSDFEGNEIIYSPEPNFLNNNHYYLDFSFSVFYNFFISGVEVNGLSRIFMYFQVLISSILHIFTIGEILGKSKNKRQK